jgi:hypothetical protein
VPAKPCYKLPRSGCSLYFVSASLSLLNLEGSVAAYSILKIAAVGSSAKAHCSALTMERLFSPCTRLHDIIESQGRLVPPEGLQELNLDVSTDEFLTAERAFTYADLYAMLGNRNTFAWLTQHTAVAREGRQGVHSWGELQGSCRFSFSADGKEIVALARSPEHLLDICDVVLRLLAASVVHSVILDEWSFHDGALINAPTLAYLMEQCQSLNVLILGNVEALDEDHCRVLGSYSRPGLEIKLICCKLTSAGASALAEVLGRNQGPTELSLCENVNSILADGLRGNSRLKSLTPRTFRGLELDKRGLLAITGALKENEGLLDLHLWYDFMMSDETWDVVCDTLKTHPTLQVLHLRSIQTFAESPAVIKSRIQAVVKMLKVNMSIHTVCLRDHYREHELFQGSVIPYLETNMLRPRVRAIQKTRPIAYGAKVLGRALLVVRNDPNRFWMLLSGNPEVVFRLTAATTTTATAAATSNVAAVAAISPIIGAASTISVAGGVAYGEVGAKGATLGSGA